jgi:hypothetical protein
MTEIQPTEPQTIDQEQWQLSRECFKAFLKSDDAEFWQDFE